MPAYSFQRQFAEPIIAGTKGGTIRAPRRIPAKWSTYARERHPGGHARIGDPLYLYTGMRTKHCRLICEKTCLAVEPITLDFAGDGHFVLGEDARTCHYAIGLKDFARFDGFESWADMRWFWRSTHGVDYFIGWHIRWLPLPPLLAAQAA